MVDCKSRWLSIKQVNVRQIGLIEIKCPKYKINGKIDDLVHDQSFYVKCEDGAPVLKKDHPYGYYAQMQMAVEHSQTNFMTSL